MSARGQLSRRAVLLALSRSRKPLTVREIGEEVELSSTSSVHAHLDNLARLGLVRHVAGWELTEAGKTAIADGHPTRQPWEPRKRSK